jgi:hypothetical protein
VTLIETYYAQVATARERRLPDPYPRGAVFIVLDARTEYDLKLADRADTGLLEGVIAGAGLTSTVLLNRVSSATLAEMIVRYSPDDATARTLRQNIRQLERSGYLRVRDIEDKDVRVVHIALSRVSEIGNHPFAGFDESVNNIATYFNIDPAEAEHCFVAAELLIRERYSARLEQIAQDLKAPPGSRPQ